MLDIGCINIPYQRPTAFFDPYGIYSDIEKKHILQSTELTCDDFSKLFNPRPIGTYDESVFFLSNILELIKEKCSFIFSEHDEQFEEMINYFFIWLAMYNSCLEQDNLWQFVDSFLYDFFTVLTSQYKLDECNKPFGAEYIDLYLYTFSHFAKEDNLPNIMEKYLVQRFSSLDSYVDCAWFIFMLYSFITKTWGLYNAHYSRVLSSWYKNEVLRNKAITGIIKEICSNPTLTDYWTKLMDTAMLF